MENAMKNLKGVHKMMSTHLAVLANFIAIFLECFVLLR
jgi:hypothetical protein